MPKLNSRTGQRRLAAAAATALVVGGSFLPAGAAQEVSEEMPDAPSSPATGLPGSSAPVSVQTTPASAPAGGLDDAEGLRKAVERDLGQTVDEFNEEAKASQNAARIREEPASDGIMASASVENGKAAITVAEEDEAEDKANVEASAAEPAAIITDLGPVNDVQEVYEEVLDAVKPSELSRLTAIMETSDGLQILASGSNAQPVETSPTPRSASVEPSLTLEQFVELAPGVELVEGSGPARSSADENLLGGMAYSVVNFSSQVPDFQFCSTGFNAWSPTGEDAVLTAGHCSFDGHGTILGLMEQTAPNEMGPAGAPLGNFGFSQFGGMGNSGIPQSALDGLDEEEQDKVLDGVEPGTDIAVVDEINPALKLPAAVTNWTVQGPHADSVELTGVSRAVLGDSACSSGRTSGWNCSIIVGVGVFFVTGYSNDQRPVWGYAMENPGQQVVDEGDSGGPMLVGARAVGITSAYSEGPDGIGKTDDDLAFYTSLADVMAEGYIEGYQVKFRVNAPEVTSVANGGEVVAGKMLAGTVAEASEGTVVEVGVGSEAVQTVEVSAAGDFSFPAPDREGPFEFTLKAVNGFNSSEQVEAAAIVVLPEPTLAPSPTEEPSQGPSQSPTQDVEPTREPTPSDSATASVDEFETPGSPQPTEPTRAPSAEAELADTGFRGVWLVLASGVLAVLGAALLLRRRSRRHG